MHNFKHQPGRKIAQLLDTAQLESDLSLHSEACLNYTKVAVAQINDGLKSLYHEGIDVEDIVYGRAYLIDRLLITVFKHLFRDVNQTVSLIAVGGYGRGELHPASDVDLMLLLAEKENEQTKDALERFLTLLWDSRLEIGHSVRTLDECVAEAEKDITVVTNIMESRLLTGDQTLFEQMQFKTGPDSIWDSQSFFQAKLEEQLQRSGKYNDTAYSLEPNIKGSQGGLRDIQMIGWVAKRHFNAKNMHDLVDKDFLQQDELNTLIDGQRLLWKIRCSLHYLAGRREDRLLFDYQRDLANEFGFKDGLNDRNNQAIEQFMQQYYRTVMELGNLNEMLLQLFREAILYANKAGDPDIINDAFQTRHGYLEIRDCNLFKEHPTELLKLFYIMQQHPEIQGVRAETIRLIRHHTYLIDDDFRASTKAKKLFMKIISNNRGITHELRRMNRYGILAAYIPAFESIVGRMQYDLFHAYTVDQHTLFLIRNLRRFSVTEFCHEFPLASGIFHHLNKPELLYLAGMFHDIAKGRAGDHAILGAEDALEFCISHNMDTADAELVSWLVRSHLIMSMTAQRKDISDPDIIQNFAENVRSLSRLDYLYLLTISDIRATNPKQWNSWKDNLLTELYNRTASLLQKGLESGIDRPETIQLNQTDALRMLDLKGISTYQSHDIWKNLNDEYFLRHTPGEIVWHTQLIFNLKNGNKPLVKSRINNLNDSVELFIYTPAKEGIFATVVSTVGQLGLNIVSAEVVNCKNNYALETFKIISNNYTLDVLEHSVYEMIPNLRKKLAGDTSQYIDSSLSTPRRHKHFDIPTTITFENTNEPDVVRIYIDTVDRHGLLAIIAKAFIDCNIGILSAKISTAGEKAVDYFDIRHKDVKQTLDTSNQEKLKSTLLSYL
ncbi:MAG: [protein-PII] uridylyltransferase [Gammaproteobacteria bacterium]|jgi:[protein-PII] uridylyltransferase|nr:[protein-PII] uridylyltransferase [Gammaproteobacteria bacterium]